MAESCGLRFVLLLIMPNINLREYFNHEVSYDDYQEFRKVLNRHKIRIKKLNLDKKVWAQPVKDYFLKFLENEESLKIKNRKIIERVVFLAS